MDCVIKKKSWKPQPIFRLIQIRGQVAEDEMYHVFNMGIGMVLFVRSKDAEEVREKTRGIIIGRIEKGKGRVNLA